ncbi:MAG: MoaD/ThiS family protein [Flavobacteriales bacterium]
MGQNIKCHFLLFGVSRELLNQSAIPAEWPLGILVSDIRLKLNSLAPALIPLNYAIAINQVYAQDDIVVPDGAEIAVLPPVSGG